jgi:hypothetical protein
MIEPDKASLLSPDDQATVRHRADRDRCEHGAISALPLILLQKSVVSRGWGHSLSFDHWLCFPFRGN